MKLGFKKYVCCVYVYMCICCVYVYMCIVYMCVVYMCVSVQTDTLGSAIRTAVNYNEPP